jgi:S-methylmethionine-dependent homocysteine/selenocysteine methylase
MDMRQLLDRHDLILSEAAIVERLRRSGNVTLHPTLVNAALIYDEIGRRELEHIYRSYIDVAHNAGLPILLCAPTWRAYRKRVLESEVSPDINRDAMQFMNGLRPTHGPGEANIKIGGLIGCKNDCYKPEEGLSVEESEVFHSWQVARLAQTQVDFLTAETLPNVQEAIGIAKAMAASKLPYFINFVINRNGCVLDGTPLAEAVRIADDALADPPLGYMVNCAHPSFLNAAKQPLSLYKRLIGYQANASSLDHTDLDGAEQLHEDEIPAWGNEMLSLHRTYGVKILGGCCGTGVEHLKYLVTNR